MRPTRATRTHASDDHAASPDAGGVPWTGQWVADRIGIDVVTTHAPLGLDLTDVVGLAVRRNPRRAHLLVSRLLGKHVPTDPRVVDGAGLVLGELVRQALAPGDGAAAGVPTPRARLLAQAVRAGADADDGSADHPVDALGRLPRRPDVVTPALVLGYAETATALGQCVADALGAPYLHSTRRRVPGVPPVGVFEEEHSHATTHVLLPADPTWLTGRDPLVLVDDELSTGQTVLNTIAELHALAPRERYVVATLVDVRTAADRRRTAERAVALGTRIDVVALVLGEVLLPPDVADRGRLALAAADAGAAERVTERVTGHVTGHVTDGAVRPGARRVSPRWPEGVSETGRHGVSREDGLALDRHLAEVVPGLGADLLTHAGPGPADILVLGTEELMTVPLRLAAALADHLGPRARVRFSTTTRSPVLAVPDSAYAIRSTLRFPAHDGPVDGPGPRFAHNLAGARGSTGGSTGGSARGARFDAVLVVVDAAADTPELREPGGLLDVLGDVARDVVVLALPDAAADRARRARQAGQTGLTPPGGTTPGAPGPGTDPTAEAAR